MTKCGSSYLPRWSLMSWFIAITTYYVTPVSSTVDLFVNTHQCNAPSTDEIYMGSPAKVGSDLQLSIEGSSVKTDNEVFEVIRGTDTNQEIELFLAAPKTMQMVVHFSNGMAQNEEDYRVNCQGKQILISQLDAVIIRFQMPKSEESNTVITVGYAPYYTAVKVQKFIINYTDDESVSKPDL